MGFLDFLRRKTEKPKQYGLAQAFHDSAQESHNKKSKNDLDERNSKYQEHRNDEIIRLRSKYNFDTLEGIKAIPVPASPVNQGSATGQIDYYLRILATQYKQDERMDMAIACLRKANDLMPHSTIGWQGKDYLRLVDYLRNDGQFEEARAVEDELKSNYPELFDDGTIQAVRRLKDTIKRAKAMHTDLIEMSAHSPTCGECAKYQGRVFSISGKNPTFPALPKSVVKYGGLHAGCRHIFYPYLEGSLLASSKFDPVRYSNRPFADDRSEIEKALYDEEKQRKMQHDYDKEEYNLICERFPEIAPKSFGGYRKMKSSRSKNFLKLQAVAKENGIEI